MDDWNLFWNALGSLGTIGAAFGAGWFGWKQHEINRRLKDIQDFVAVSILGFFAENEPKLQIKNVGRINLYLHKWEIGGSGEIYKKPRLLGCSPDLSFMVPVPNQPSTEMSVKIYLTDEYGQRYVSEGSVIIQSRMSSSIQNQTTDSTQAQQQAEQQFLLQQRIFSWSYRTMKRKWLL